MNVGLNFFAESYDFRVYKRIGVVWGESAKKKTEIKTKSYPEVEAEVSMVAEDLTYKNFKN